MRLKLLFLLLALSAATALSAADRIWTDRSGRTKLRAELLGVSMDKLNVVVRRADGGGAVALPVSKLSRADQIFLQATLRPKAPRTWTAASGKSMVAQLVSADEGKVTLKDNNGREAALSVARLSRADQMFLKTATAQLKADEAAKAELAKLQGRWKCTGCYAEGVRKEFALVWLISGTEIDWRETGKLLGAPIDFKLNALQTPKHLDFCYFRIVENDDGLKKNSPTLSQFHRFIYSLERDKLIVSGYVNSPHRPKTTDPKELRKGEVLFVWVFKRIPTKDKPSRAAKPR